MSIRWTTICPAKAPLTEANLPDQKDKVFLVTGASGGIGKELSSILYQRNGTVYLAARSASKVDEVIEEIRKQHPKSSGKLKFLPLVLDDLTTIKATANEFLAQESRLDVLFNNAGVMVPPQGSTTKQGFELQLGVNNMAHQLLTHLLTPTLVTTASIAPKDSVRVIWVSSSAADNAPKPAINFSNMDYHNEEGIWPKYSRSKAGSVIQASEFARRNPSVLSLSLNPGNFVTNLQQNMPAIQLAMFKLMAHPVKNGAYTELFAAFHPSITTADNGTWVSPFGKKDPARQDLLNPKLGRDYWDWIQQRTLQYQ